MKRKILVAILAIAMIAGTLAAPLAQVFAAGTEKNVTGTWYGSSIGIPIIMDVMENGTYKVSVDDGNEEEGVWTVENDEFVMDKDTDYEMSLQFDGDSIFLYNVISLPRSDEVRFFYIFFYFFCFFFSRLAFKFKINSVFVV